MRLSRRPTADAHAQDSGLARSVPFGAERERRRKARLGLAIVFSGIVHGVIFALLIWQAPSAKRMGLLGLRA